jgi:hypothetical protein
MPTNGGVAKVWREMQGDKKEEALRAIRNANTAKYLAAPGADLPSQEERERMAAEFAKLAEDLK